MNSSRNHTIDNIRLLSALLVLYGHGFVLANGLFNPNDVISNALRPFLPFHISLHGLGMAMLFFLSGYLVALSFERQKLGYYISARLTRIYPGLFVCIILTAILVGLFASSRPFLDFILDDRTINSVWGTVTLLDVRASLPGVFANNPRPFTFNGSLWTLPVEMILYGVVLVLGVSGILKRRWLFNSIFFISLTVFILFYPELSQGSYKRYIKVVPYFIYGVFFYRNRDVISYNPVVFCCGVIACYLTWNSSFYNICTSVYLSYCLCYLCFNSKVRMLPLYKGGDLTYGVYLYAFPLQQFAIMLVGRGHPYLINAIAAVFSIL